MQEKALSDLPQPALPLLPLLRSPLLPPVPLLLPLQAQDPDPRSPGLLPLLSEGFHTHRSHNLLHRCFRLQQLLPGSMTVISFLKSFSSFHPHASAYL